MKKLRRVSTGPRFAVYPYKMGSNSASELARALGTKCIKHEGSKFRKWSDPKMWIINWGSGHCPKGHSVLNPSINTQRAGNKLQFFQLIKDYARVPEFTSSKQTAAGWFTKPKDLVVCREVLTGHSGAGIVIAESADNLTQAPLYTKYIPKDSEFRLHFISGRRDPFFIQRKARRTDHPGEHDVRVRNLKGGYVYVHDAANVGEVPEDVLEQGRLAFSQSHLDFGACDVLYNKKQNKAYILEFNTAPGLEGATINAYAEAFKSLVR